MRSSKAHYPSNLKLLILGFLLAFLLLFILRSSFSSSQQNPSSISQSNQSSKESNSIEVASSTTCPPSKSTKTCNKIPPTIAQALIHYSTSNITPQQTLREISVTAKILEKKSPCNFLVFGLGHDSLMWSTLNHGGRTVFLEEDKSWIEQIKQRFPMLESYHVVYDSKVNQAEDLMEVGKGEECTSVGDPRNSVCQLALKGMPNEVYEIEWDLIMVDAPTGYHEDAPGRMSAIYTAGMMARNREEGETDVFVHDVNRVVEDKFSKAFLCDGYMKIQEGRLRHFKIPSHRENLGRPFCP
ncbi:putative polysaccharide biosynthesis protein [Macleaya cordata]|uniref:Putative polysaccharide biosynthesis protein n=1 Tax=Macleaya cordata TaxID=56857 RepID=A0A200PPL2_MACCD|nr:putative polysaccharide biosynthesis protein [Macleaya cordata]